MKRGQFISEDFIAYGLNMRAILTFMYRMISPPSLSTFMGSCTEYSLCRSANISHLQPRGVLPSCGRFLRH
jgi:hypothetical protein